MNIQLSPETEELLRARVEEGRFSSIDDAVEQSVRMLLETDEQDEHWSWLRAEIQKGVESSEAGHYGPLDLEDLKRRARQRLEEVRASARS